MTRYSFFKDLCTESNSFPGSLCHAHMWVWYHRHDIFASYFAVQSDATWKSVPICLLSNIITCQLSRFICCCSDTFGSQRWPTMQVCKRISSMKESVTVGGVGPVIGGDEHQEVHSEDIKEQCGAHLPRAQSCLGYDKDYLFHGAHFIELPLTFCPRELPEWIH